MVCSLSWTESPLPWIELHTSLGLICPPIRWKGYSRWSLKPFPALKISWFHDCTYWNLGLSPLLSHLTLGHHPPPHVESGCTPHSLLCSFHLNNFPCSGKIKSFLPLSHLFLVTILDKSKFLPLPNQSFLLQCFLLQTHNQHSSS